MTRRITGFHHITMICGDAQRNLDFYTGPLGLRLVKLNVNMDDPSAYHLYYGDGVGTVGSILTFFPYPGARAATVGKGMIVGVDLDVPSGSLEYWKERLAEHGIGSDPIETDSSGRRSLGFRDPDGISLRFTELNGGALAPTWEGAKVPAEHAVRRFVGVRIAPSEMGPRTHLWKDTPALLKGLMGFEDAGRSSDGSRYSLPGSDGYVEVLREDSYGFGHGGVGSVHHVAFDTPDANTQIELREELIRGGLRPSPVIERNYFRSVYFREPSAVLYEIATTGPGFTIDESLEELGSRLSLPPWLEDRRDVVESHLPRLVLPNETVVGR